jgi:diguanylate cyclase (GGDEF)-like protein
MTPSASISTKLTDNLAGVTDGLSALLRAVQGSCDSLSSLPPTPRDSTSSKLEAIAILVEKLCPRCFCSISIFAHGKIRHVAGQSLPAKFARRLAAGVPVSNLGPTFAAAACADRPLLSLDIAADPAWLPFRMDALAAGVRGCWSTAIYGKTTEQVLGTICIYSPTSESPAKAELEVLQLSAQLVAVALGSGRPVRSEQAEPFCDRVTGLPNQALLEDLIQSQKSSSKRTATEASVLWIDLQRLEEITKRLGESMGEILMRQVTQRLFENLKSNERLARLGPAAFGVLLEHSKGQSAERRARNFVSAFDTPFVLNGYEFVVTPSIGVSGAVGANDHAQELFRTAKAAMQKASNLGGGYVVHTCDLETSAREKLDVECDLRRALQRRELRLFYQPQVDLRGTVTGMEALIRWDHPTRGLLAPGQFMESAEETGLIVPIGTWVIREACRQAAEWSRTNITPLKVAVNVSSLQFYFSDVVDIVRKALEETGLPGHLLEIELTETLLMRNCDEAAKSLQKLRLLGVTIAIDDFGTGYSSLSYLQKLPIDLLKIDRSFLQNIEAESTGAVVNAITALAHSLGLRVVAEGIETQLQMDAVSAMGVDFAQGYLFGRPMSAAAVDAILCAAHKA